MAVIIIPHVKKGLTETVAVDYGEWGIMLCDYPIMILAIFSK